MTGHQTRLPMNSIRREPTLDLDGTWQFQLLPEAGSKLQQDWEEVQVPSLWTMTSDKAIPQYTNVIMPFDEAIPNLPADNPQGIYRRSFTYKPGAGKRVILHVGAAEGALEVLVNSNPVGTSTDSHLAAEFDITDAVLPGENTLELRVTKWSVESYLEDQDQWWQFGISRSISLHEVPEVRLGDVIVTADFDPASSRGSLHVDARTVGLNHLSETGHSIRVVFHGESQVKDVAGRVVQPGLPVGDNERESRPAPMLPEGILDLVSMQAAAAPIPPEYRAIPNIMGGQFSGDPAGTAVFQLDELEVSPWSSEDPVLEDVLVELVDDAGTVVDSAAYRVGFRRVEIVGRDLLINGERVLIQGVNRHDLDPLTGRVISRERMREELSLLKRFNFNAIRTSHYPNDPYLLDLCDEYGLYVVDEASIEAHAYASTVPDNPLFLEPMLERVKRMVLRDRNHASVITWSLGNESGYGAAHDAAAAWVRRTDATRPVQYEGAISLDWHGGQGATDILCPMYPAFQSLESYAQDNGGTRPLITCEYAYSQGNGTGGLGEYWDLFENQPGLQGGFIWEFVDHALDRDGDGHYRYGGDFGDEPNDGTIGLNGIAFPDLTPKPAMFEARGIFSPVRIVSDAQAALAGKIRLKSRRNFRDLSDLRLVAFVETRAGSGHGVELEVELGAGREAQVQLPADLVSQLRGSEALALSVRVELRNDTMWAGAGTEIAVQQVRLPHVARALPAGGGAPVTNDGTVQHPLLAEGPRLNLWRAMAETDNSFALDKRFTRSGFFTLTQHNVWVTEGNVATKVEIEYRTAWDESVFHTREITQIAEGDFVFHEEVRLPEGTRDGLAVGIEFRLADGFEAATWDGLGPWENYPDRQRSALRGHWESAIDDLPVQYVFPQGNGTRGGVDAATLVGPDGRVALEAEQPMHLTISRYSIAEIEGAKHWWELDDSRATYVQFDLVQRGIGTALLGPDTRPEYRLPGTEYSWSWRLQLN